VAAPTITGTVALTSNHGALRTSPTWTTTPSAGSTYSGIARMMQPGTTNRVAIAGATGETYTITSDDSNKYLVFESRAAHDDRHAELGRRH
jgi:hypothetical protein